MSAQPMSPPHACDARRLLCLAMIGLAFLGAVAMLSLPGARAAGALGWMPLWLLGMPLAALLALRLADLRERMPRRRAPVPSSAGARRRIRPAQARRRPGSARVQPGMPAAA